MFLKIESATDFIKNKNFASIAINMSTNNAQADEISFTQYQQLIKASGPKFSQQSAS